MSVSLSFAFREGRLPCQRGERSPRAGEGARATRGHRELPARGTRVQGATLGAAPTHVHTHIPSPPHVIPSRSLRKAGAGSPSEIEAQRRNAGSGRRRTQRGEELGAAAAPGPPTGAPIPMPRASVTYLIHKPSRAGGKFSGQTQISGLWIHKRGASLKSHTALVARGKGGSGTEGVSFWDDTVLGGTQRDSLFWVHQIAINHFWTESLLKRPEPSSPASGDPVETESCLSLPSLSLSLLSPSSTANLLI